MNLDGRAPVVSARELAILVVESLRLEDVDPEQLDVTAPMFGDGLGLDSLDMLEISLVIQQRYGVKLKADDPNNEAIFASLQSLADHIGATQGAYG
jgi:acyl carrier protein